MWWCPVATSLALLIVPRDLEQRDCCKPRRNTRDLRMVVGGWSEPEFHARDRRGWRSRWRLNSFSARLRFARLDCLAAQVGLLSLIS